MASVLTPYRSSDGNNPYTEAQLKVLWNDLEPQAREPGKYSLEERVLLQREFLKYVEQGYTATRACLRLQELSKKDPCKWPFADYATFMAWKAYDQNFSDAYEVAYAMGTDNLEDKGVEMAYGGNASMLQFLLKARNSSRYSPKQEIGGIGGGAIEHVHTIKLVAAQPKVVEGDMARSLPAPERMTRSPDVVDAEIVDE